MSWPITAATQAHARVSYSMVSTVLTIFMLSTPDTTGVKNNMHFVHDQICERYIFFTHKILKFHIIPCICLSEKGSIAWYKITACKCYEFYWLVLSILYKRCIFTNLISYAFSFSIPSYYMLVLSLKNILKIWSQV